MIINRDTMLTELKAALPEFAINPDWVSDKMGYLVINDLGHYLCEEAKLSNWTTVKQGMQFLECSLKGNDSYMRGLVHEALEILLSCSEVGGMKRYFGARTLALWDQFMEPTYKTILRDKDLR